jgi:hypothetical protein
MRKTFLLIPLIFLAAFSCTENKGSKAGRKAARIEFTETQHDFGEIKFDGDGSVEFRFTNTGRSPLILDNVRSTCGCTVPEWTKKPVAPSDSGTIRVIYDTHRVGAFSKALIVYSNAANSPVRIFIKGTVLPFEESSSDSTKIQ